MDVLQYSELQKFLFSFSHIRLTISEWRFAEISLTPQDINIQKVAGNLQDFFKEREGTVLICNSHELIALIRIGQDSDSAVFYNDIKNTAKNYDCVIKTEDVTESVLEKIELRLRDLTKKNVVIMIADDDMYVRSNAAKALNLCGKIVEVATGDAVLPAYKKERPDIVFLDIHLPGCSGMTLIDEIIGFDPEACIIMLSADSSKENVLAAHRKGAQSFITKPFTKHTIEDRFHRCFDALQKIHPVIKPDVKNDAV